MIRQGLFVGLATLDLIYLAERLPQTNQKAVAQEMAIAAGGPAANAAVTFAHLGNQATLLTALGAHPITQLIRSDLSQHSLAIADLIPEQTLPPPISSIIVTEGTGERAVVSLNAKGLEASPKQIPTHILDDIEIVLIDGHQIEVGAAIAHQAHERGIPVVLDGGSWKPGLDTILPFVDYAICSADFYPPQCQTTAAVIDYLNRAMTSRQPQDNLATAMVRPQIVITNGSQPIQYVTDQISGWIEVPTITPVDTMGAGDVFHGSFCHFILESEFTTALSQSAEVAADSCQFFGPRSWLQSPRAYRESLGRIPQQQGN